MRDVDVASVVVVCARGRRRAKASCFAVLCLWAAGQRSHKLAISSLRSLSRRRVCVLESWLAQGKIDAAAARPKLGDGRFLLVLLQGDVSARALELAVGGLDWTGLDRSNSSQARATDRAGKRGREG